MHSAEFVQRTDFSHRTTCCSECNSHEPGEQLAALPQPVVDEFNAFGLRERN